MELNINIITDAHCKVIIEDKSEYLNESSNTTQKGRFKYSDTASIVILQHNKISGAEVKAPSHNKHTSQYIEVPIQFDGWFTINYLVLPTEEWFVNNYESNYSALSIYDIVYFTDGTNIYKYVPNKSTSASTPSNANPYQYVDMEEVLEVNPVNTTISKVSKDYISICFLQKCYINLCQQIFNDRAFSQCWNKSDVDSELIYKRDLVWMAINVIKYLTEFCQLAEVERIIERINGCNGLCKSNSTNLSTSSGCGCSK